MLYSTGHNGAVDEEVMLEEQTLCTTLSHCLQSNVAREQLRRRSSDPPPATAAYASISSRAHEAIGSILSSATAQQGHETSAAAAWSARMKSDG
jgi:hypothetical protein